MALNIQQLSAMTPRQKATAGLFVIIVLIILWQAKGLFGGGEEAAPPASLSTINAGGAISPSASGGASPPQLTPQPESLPRSSAMSPRELELMRLQQETEAKYITALNELQMLKIERQIADVNKAIMSAKLDTITAQKNIVNLLTVPQPQVTRSTYTQGLLGPSTTEEAAAASSLSSAQAAPQQQVSTTNQEVSYTVISVSQIKYKWNAVLGYQGRLYSITVGDVMPLDGSKVVSIDGSGVVLEKDGVRKKISLVPII